MFNLPNSIAPACWNLLATVQSSAGMNVSNILEPEVVRTPAVLYRSFSPTGMPCNGPLYLPDWMSFSACRAANLDSSANSVMKEFKIGSVASILER